MSHFSTGSWVDFIRGLPPAEASAMQDHLDKSCGECRESLKLWQSVSTLFAKEARYYPPEEAVRTAKAAYGPGKYSAWFTQIAQTTRLAFDSFQLPAPVMLRSSGRSSRQLVHEAEPFVIDLRLESDPVRQRVSLIGQILNSTHPKGLIRTVDVILLSGENVLLKTAANASGEFDLEFRREEDLRLFINIRGQRAIGIILPDVEN